MQIIFQPYQPQTDFIDSMLFLKYVWLKMVDFFSFLYKNTFYLN